ncbi:MAG TPA: heme peroxidase family protein, partial [Ramlibacter sp.]
MIHHGQLFLRDLTPARSVYHEPGRFGRLFPHLPPFAKDSPELRAALVELGKAQGDMDANDPDPTGLDPEIPEQEATIIGANNSRNPDNPAVDGNGRPLMTAGMTFLGQFIDHDLTFDTTSSLERQNDPESIANFRTPLLELDSVYGSGRAVNAHLYDRDTDRLKFLIDKKWPRDLPRNSQDIALIADPRNDENVILSQLHLAFLKFHNAAVDWVGANTSITDANDVFTEAQKLVRWHYQWIVIYEFLYKTVGQELVHDILENGRKFYSWQKDPFIPVEFSVAAFRFGHSQVRPGYVANHGDAAVNAGARFVAPILNICAGGGRNDPDDLRGGGRAARRFIHWDTFFDLGTAKLRPNKRIDHTLSSLLLRLPFNSPGLPEVNEKNSLAVRNLIRHITFDLPSGQAVARAMSEQPVTMELLEKNACFRKAKLHESTPLWFYILEEAAVQQEGKRLGKVGGRIVAEVILGLLQGDRQSFLSQDPRWQPIFGPG